MAHAKEKIEMEEAIVDPLEYATNLRNKVELKDNQTLDFDPVERAEAALKKLSTSFDNWILDEVATLITTWMEATDANYDIEALDAFFRAAHDLKGQAPTFGFPLAGATAASLCRLLEIQDKTLIPEQLVEQHVQAIKAIVREAARGKANETGCLLATLLEKTVEQYLERIAA